MLGFADHLSSGTLADVSNVAPIFVIIHKRLDKARPEALIYPSEATSVEAARVAEEALARQEASPDDFKTTSSDFLEGWPNVHTVDGKGYRYYEYHLGLYVSAYSLDRAGLGLRKAG